MSEMSPENNSFSDKIELVDKPLADMSLDEHKAWYLEYVKSVPEENFMMVSGLLLEIDDDPKAFADYVTAFQQLKRQGMA